MSTGLKFPKTSAEVNNQSTIQGKRAAILAGMYDSALIMKCFETARRDGLNGEDTYTLIAYHALLELEDFAVLHNIVICSE